MDGHKSGFLRRRLKNVSEISNNEDAMKVPAIRRFRLHFCFYSLLKSFLIFFVFLGLFVFLNYVLPPSGSYQTSVWDRVANTLYLQHKRFVVVIDAGSTGSRVVVFAFLHNVPHNTLKLHEEHFKEIKLGLASFAESPNKVVEIMQQLLDFASSTIPLVYHSHTSLVFRATAGFRLLPDSQSETLLSVCRDVIGRYGFDVQPEHTAADAAVVQVMSGVDEGVFSWFTVNFLNNRLSKHTRTETSAVLDLGGGSLQVTFVPPVIRDTPHPSMAVHRQHSSDIFTIRLNAHDTLDVYTKSFLGAGLMAARHSLLVNDSLLLLPSSRPSLDSTEPLREYTSVCVSPRVSRTPFTYQNTVHYITGSVEANFNACYQLARNFVTAVFSLPDEVSRQPIYAISYFYDRVTDALHAQTQDSGHNSTRSTQHSVSLHTLHAVTRGVCSHTDATHTVSRRHPFVCLDLVYILALLRDALHLSDTHTVHVAKSIDGHETSWALGAAYHRILLHSL